MKANLSQNHLKGQKFRVKEQFKKKVHFIKNWKNNEKKKIDDIFKQCNPRSMQIRSWISYNTYFYPFELEVRG